MLTQQRLKEVLQYCPESGHFTWKISRGKAKQGSKSGSLTHKGYIRITVDGEEYRAHRLAVLYMTGEFPKQLVDHKFGNKADNRWSEIREASPTENGRNGKLMSNNTSGFKGVVWVKCRSKWRANARVEGVRKFLGYFDSAQAASEVYESFVKPLYGEFYKAHEVRA